MKILVFPDSKASYTIKLERVWHFLIPASMIISLTAALIGLGYSVGAKVQSMRMAESPMVDQWRVAIRGQRQEIENARQTARIGIDVLTERLGELQGHVNRLDALGNRLVQMAKIDSDEFDFSSPPAMGGSEEPASGARDYSLLDTLDQMAAQLKEREAQLYALDRLIMTHNLEEAIYPAGMPVSAGYMSSGFGSRKDPFSGRMAMHKGLDFAGKSGQNVLAVADGVVSFSGRRGAYGNMVELDHGNGYVTRYGHNQRNLVTVGQRIKKGEAIARMGSTGRSTGTHVHFEVLKDGSQVNPKKFVASAAN